MAELIIYYIESYTYQFDHTVAWVFGLAMLAFWIWSVVYVANRKTEDSTQKVCWMLILLFLGPIGTLLYFLAGRELSDKRRKEGKRRGRIPPFCFGKSRCSRGPHQEKQDLTSRWWTIPFAPSSLTPCHTSPFAQKIKYEIQTRY